MWLRRKIRTFTEDERASGGHSPFRAQQVALRVSKQRAPKPIEARCVIADMGKALRGWLALSTACAILTLSTGCGSSPQGSRNTPASAATASATRTEPAPSPSPSARPQPTLALAILVHADAPFQASTPSPATSYYVALVSANGTIVASANPRVPSALTMTYANCPVIGGSLPTCQIAFRPRAPLVTSSDTRAYFLDGDSDVGYLTPDGRTGTAIHLPASPRVRYAVAVTPDDTRIAVAAFDYVGSGTYGNPAVTLNLFIQDLAGGNRVDLFNSTSVTEWPIGWHDGHLVIAVGPAGLVQYTVDNPYFTIEGYHVADATNGDRLATIGTGDECVHGPVVRAGAACLLSREMALGYRSWDGIGHIFAPWQDFGPTPGALSPNGIQLAGSNTGPPEESHVNLISASGVSQLNAKGIVQGWLDDKHVVYFAVPSSRTFILDLATGLSAAVQQTNPPGMPGSPSAYLQFLGTVPQQMS